MTPKLLIEAIIKYIFGILLAGILIFLPAGTFRFPNGWLLMGVLFVPIFIAGIVMTIKSPALLEKRINGKEKQKDQRIVVKLSGLMFLLGFIAAGLQFRFGILPLPAGISYAAAAVLLFAYLLYAEVMRENAYLSRTIEVREEQKVIDTGLYGVVRHPMYAATVLLFLAMPLVLGSIIAFVIFLLYPLIIIKRIRGEEAFLEKELPGYTEYQKKVRYRLIPFVW